jgi:hypothetical protein
MIKALLLLIRPVPTWDGIERARRSIASVLGIYLLPLILLTSAVEGYALMHWGKIHKGETTFLKKYVLGEAVVIEMTQALLYCGIAFLGAYAAKSFAGTFHRRHNYTGAFTAVAYGMGPLLTLRLADLPAWPNPWVSWVPWAVGMVLTVAVLYHGLPCILKPDPPHAFGLFVMTVMTLTVIFGLHRLLTFYLFIGRFRGLDEMLTRLVGGSPA